MNDCEAVERQMRKPPLFHIVPCANIKESPSRATAHEPALNVLVVTEHICMHSAMLTSTSVIEYRLFCPHVHSYYTVYGARPRDIDGVYRERGTCGVVGRESDDGMLRRMWRRSIQLIRRPQTSVNVLLVTL